MNFDCMASSTGAVETKLKCKQLFFSVHNCGLFVTHDVRLRFNYLVIGIG